MPWGSPSSALPAPAKSKRASGFGASLALRLSQIRSKVKEDEFFARTVSHLAPAAAPGGRKRSLATIAAKEVLESSLAGVLSFKDEEIERDWRRYARKTYWRGLVPACATLFQMLLFLDLIMATVTIYLHYKHVAPSDSNAEDLHVRDDALRWTVALSTHLCICVVLLLGFRKAAPAVAPALLAPARKNSLQPGPPTEVDDPSARTQVRIAHTIFASWFTLWLGTLGYLCVASKYAATDAARKLLEAGLTTLTLADRRAELLEHARATNNSTALVALVSLSCFMRSFKLSYVQCAFVGLLLLISTIVAWCLQPPSLPLEQQQAVMWTNLVWVLVAMVTEIALVRAGEKVRRRLFHLQRVMETSNTHLLRENQMLQASSSSGKTPDGDLLDLESPVQKVLKLLREMQSDASLIEWQAAIEQAVHKLSRAKLHDLFLPSAAALGHPAHPLPEGEHAETEMVEQILGEMAHHDDQDELTDRTGHASAREHKLDDGTLVEERRQQILKDVTKARFGRVGRGITAAFRIKDGVGSTLNLLNRVTPNASPDRVGTGAAESSTAPSREESFSPNGSPTRDLGADDRLRLIADSMPVWGSGEHTIFGLDAACGPDLLFFILEHAFREFDLFEHFDIDAQKVYELSLSIVNGYNDHPYHNRIHACDVTQGTYWMLRQRMPSVATAAQAKGGDEGLSWSQSSTNTVEKEVWQLMPGYAVLAALVGAAIHDIGHDAVNNAYHVATGSELAITYNDKSCLESMHASKGLSLLRGGTTCILEHMPLDQRRKFRTLVIDLIMGTDLANHFEQLSQMQTKMAEGEGLHLCGEKSDLALFLGNVMHAADLGSTAHTPVVYFNWMQRVFREFFAQGEMERAAGLPVTPFMDRPTASIPKAQLGFLKYLCQPLFNAMVVVIPGVSAATDCMAENIVMLQELDERKLGTEEIMSAANLEALVPASIAKPNLLPTEC